MRTTARLLGTMAALLMTGGSVTAAETAEQYPSKPVRLVVAFSPGGGVDTIARTIAEGLTRIWEQPVVVENRPGAGSSIGTRQVARAPADGYTFLVTSTSYAVNPYLYKEPGYSADDFEPIINAGYSPTLIFSMPSTPVTTLKELVELSKAQDMSYATAGVGTISHLSTENLLNVVAGTNMTHVGYNGAGPAFQAVVGGHVPVGALPFATPGLLEWIKEGKLKPLAISGDKRIAALPEVPTIAESGFEVNADYTWVGFFAPAGTPQDIVVKANEAIGAAMREDKVQQVLSGLGFDWEPNTAEQFNDYVRSELTNWEKVVQSSGVVVE